MVSATRVRSALREIGRHELGTLLSLSALAVGGWVFAEVLDEVQEGETRGVDRALLLAFREAEDPTEPIGPAWLEEIGRDFSALGGSAVLTLLTLAVVGYLFLRLKPRAALLLFASVVGAASLTFALKQAIARPRPDLVSYHAHVQTMSFPSGHAMLSAAVYLTLGALLARLQPNLILKAYMLLWALGLSFLVGLSRVYVGVHWPTDVLGGWAAGTAWAAISWLVARWLQGRGKLEASSGLESADATPLSTRDR